MKSEGVVFDSLLTKSLGSASASERLSKFRWADRCDTAMTSRFPSESDPLAVASSDALPPVDSIRFTEPALDRVDDPARHKALDVSPLDPDQAVEDPRALQDRDDRHDPVQREAEQNGERPHREAVGEQPDDHPKHEAVETRVSVMEHDPADPPDKQDQPLSAPQDPAHVAVGDPAQESIDHAPSDEHGPTEHDLADHLHIHSGPSPHLAVLMPPHAQTLQSPPTMHPSTPPQPVKKKRRTYNTEEERRKARILKNRRTAEESRQRRMKKMKELEEYAETAAMREKKLQEEARLAKAQLAALRDSMDQVVAQKDAEIATRDAEIQRLRDELASR